MNVSQGSGAPTFSLMNDLSAGIVVFLVALPLCLGIALASGAPLMAGLLSGIVGGIVVGLLSGSKTSVSGPAAGLTAVIAAQISDFGSFETFLCALVIGGVLQIGLGVARTGFIARFFPLSVIKGLLAAIGLILLLKQIPHLVGLDLDYEGEMAFLQPDNENTLSEILKMFVAFHTGATIVGISSLVLLVAWDRLSFLKNSKIPAPLAVVIFAVLTSLALAPIDTLLFIGPEHRVQLPLMNGLNDLSQLFTWPDFKRILHPDMFTAGITIAVIASLETLLNLEAVDKIDPQKRHSPPNRELVAQGVGNCLLGLVGGLPVTSVIVRSSVNINAKASSKYSTVIHGLLLLLSVLFLSSVMNLIPLSCLAAILIVTALKLANPKIVRDMWEQGYSQFFPFMVTVTAILFTDLLVGVLIGLASSVFFILHRNSQIPIKASIENHLGHQIHRIELPSHVNFLNRASLSESLERLPNDCQVALDASNTKYIDVDVLDMLKDFKNNGALLKNITVSMLGFKHDYAANDLVFYREHATVDLQKNMTPAQVLEVLKEGNQRVREGKRLKRDLNRQISKTSLGQYPLAVFLSCIDSRVPAELIFDLGIGDAFSVRVAGNITSTNILGSLEFACAIAGAKLLVVMGHTRCGAISAAISSYQAGSKNDSLSSCKHLVNIVDEIQGVIRHKFPHHRFSEQESLDEGLINTIAQANILHTIEDIKAKSPVIDGLVSTGQIGIAGCIYDVNSGEVDFLADDVTVKGKNKEMGEHPLIKA